MTNILLKIERTKILLSLFLIVHVSLSASAQGGIMIGVIESTSLTHNPQMTWYDHHKTYPDLGIGGILGYNSTFDSTFSFEFLSSLLVSTYSLGLEAYESATKVSLPVEGRLFIGKDNFKVYYGAGLRYSVFGYSNQYGSGLDNHQLSASGAAGFSILGTDYPVHFLLGAKFNFPLLFDHSGDLYSRDKDCLITNLGVAFDLGQKSVLMLNYDYPLGNTKQEGYEGNFFEMRSQTLTISLIIRPGPKSRKKPRQPQKQIQFVPQLTNYYQ